MKIGQTKCKHGHEMTEENSYFPPTGGMECRECKSVNRANYIKRETDFKKNVLSVNKYILKGAGSDAPMIVHANGAGESYSPYRFDLLPSMAIADVAEVMARGAIKYGENNWRTLPAKSHLNHAMQHIFAHLIGDDQELDELEHARHVATRILFWLECLNVDAQKA